MGAGGTSQPLPSEHTKERAAKEEGQWTRLGSDVGPSFDGNEQRCGEEQLEKLILQVTQHSLNESGGRRACSISLSSKLWTRSPTSSENHKVWTGEKKSPNMSSVATHLIHRLL